MSDGHDIDDALITRLAADVAAGGGQALTAYFASTHAPSPTINWSPAAADLEQPVLRDLLAYWEALPGGPRFPLASAIDPLQMRTVLGLVMLLEPVDGGRDFRYRVYGTGIAERSGIDVTGQTVGAIAENPLPDYFLASYRACLSRPEPLHIQHVPPDRVHVEHWDRLILPLDDGQGQVSRLIVGNVPKTWET